MKKREVIIIGAGPAGLTAAYELSKHPDFHPVILEAGGEIGGISRTANFKGNRMDIGGHRFFSKSDRVMEWWKSILPLQGAPSRDDLILNRRIELSALPDAPDPEKTDEVMLTRNRLSRIYYLRKFFDYPVTLNADTIRNLGFGRMAGIGLSYIKSSLFKIKPEKSLEDFLTNRFGKALYLTFFKDYTEKVWGVPPSLIKPDWGSQRIKGLSIAKIIGHALKKAFSRKKGTDQKDVETSLIERFIYPKYGPGQLWETAAERVLAQGGSLIPYQKVDRIISEGETVRSVEAVDVRTGKRRIYSGDYFLSTMPVRDLIRGWDRPIPSNVEEVAGGLVYRDFITVGLLLNRLKIVNRSEYETVNDIVPDLWIYIQERDVKIGRLQVFNNWSPYLVADPNRVWLGLEYFCNEGDELWNLSEREMLKFAIDELVKIDVIDADEVVDGTVIKFPKTYPAYFGTYDRFGEIREFTDRFENLFLIGRNGMHRYNNMDHSMLTAMEAVNQIVSGKIDKNAVWEINTEKDYHEQKNERRLSNRD